MSDIRGGISEGLVYFIRCEASGLVKIGVAADPRGRLRTLQTGNASRLVLLGTRPGGRRLEKRLHARFAKCRTNGEWFRLADADLVDLLGEEIPGRMNLRVGDDNRLWSPAQHCGISSWMAEMDGLAILVDGGTAYHDVEQIIAWHEEHRGESAWDDETLEACRGVLGRFRNGEIIVEQGSAEEAVR